MLGAGAGGGIVDLDRYLWFYAMPPTCQGKSNFSNRADPPDKIGDF